MRYEALATAFRVALLPVLVLLGPACRIDTGTGGSSSTLGPDSSVTPGVPGVPGVGAPPASASASALVDVPPVPPPSPGARIEDERNTIGVFREVASSTVFVTQKRQVVDRYSGTAVDVPAGSGSGFVWDQEGHIVTNFHVIEGAQALTVTLQGDKAFPARVVGVEPRKDIAVLKIEAAREELKPIRVAPSREPLEVGQKTIAIGNPFGLDHTLTTGVVSAIGRQVDGIGGVTIRDMIQTDAAINPGNSGGPLLDSSGQLIGMNTMIYSKTGSSAGIGFAVPAATIARIVPQLVKTGRVEQVGLGIHLDPSQRLERRLRLRGVIVTAVMPGGAAEKAGLQGLTETDRGLALGDVIVGIDGAPIEDYDGLYNALDGKKVGDKAKVDVVRGRDKRSVEVDLQALPQAQ
ncbi:S1C family serine protease [Chondromyces apiculatus]|uniref:DegP protease n=1 Tax=Chondromyces apiculatus DSM 436 TaxID=1192034 RepID=A0A017T096_9BACT|nr:trypsin-like peptidase domain-containing protein [Chondromyces apiculatus]EYF01971.1 DegP protease [Chondromyces apiculatus DSM 436]